MTVFYHLNGKQILFIGLLLFVVIFSIINPIGYNLDRIKEESVSRFEKMNRMVFNLKNVMNQSLKTQTRPSEKSESIHKTQHTNWSSMTQNSIRQKQKSTARVHIATAADDEYVEGVIGLIKTAYQKSLSPTMVQFEVFHTPDQNLSMIEDLQLSKESKDNKWAIRLHQFNPNEVDSYINKQFEYSSAKGNLKSAHNYIRYILFERLKDVDYCLWIDADIAMNKDVVDFVTEKTRTDAERKMLKDSKIEYQKEYGLPGKTFRKNYVLGAYPIHLNVFDKSVYSRLSKLNFDVQGLPHFNAGFLLMNLDLWRKRNVARDMLSITKVNNDLSLWTGFGSQPALNLLLGGKKLFQLKPNTMQGGLGVRNITKLRESDYFLHWNGEHKPWLKKGFNKHLWV